MKYLIIGGCSYYWKDIPFDTSLKNEPSIFKNSYKIVHIGRSGISIEHIKESIIHNISELLESGVSSSDMYLLSNLTQIGRKFIKYPEYLLDDLSDEYKERYKIGNYITTALYQINEKTTDWEAQQITNIDNSRLPIQNFEIYLESIVILQSFLKKYNIAHTLFMMNNVFEGWDTDFKHTYSPIVGPIIPNLDNTLHIKDMSDYCKYLWNMIDLDNFIFHKTPGNNYGGIDEYALDKFNGDPSLYLANPLERGNIWYGLHPNSIVYTSFSDRYGIANKIINTLG
jgi:hypothetical protein